MKKYLFVSLMLLLASSSFAQTYMGKDALGRECKMTILSHSGEKMAVTWEGLDDGQYTSKDLNKLLSGKVTLTQARENYFTHYDYFLPVMDTSVAEKHFVLSMDEQNRGFAFFKYSITGRTYTLRCNFDN